MRERIEDRFGEGAEENNIDNEQEREDANTGLAHVVWKTNILAGGTHAHHRDAGCSPLRGSLFPTTDP